jgi:hypothetical protein
MQGKGTWCLGEAKAPNPAPGISPEAKIVCWWVNFGRNCILGEEVFLSFIAGLSFLYCRMFFLSLRWSLDFFGALGVGFSGENKRQKPSIGGSMLLTFGR